MSSVRSAAERAQPADSFSMLASVPRHAGPDIDVPVGDRPWQVPVGQPPEVGIEQKVSKAL
jgi:hypothetical protein